jgi:hypothetical protein
MGSNARLISSMSIFASAGKWFSCGQMLAACLIKEAGLTSGLPFIKLLILQDCKP